MWASTSASISGNPVILSAFTLARTDAALAAAEFPTCLVSPSAVMRVARICELWPDGAACHVLELRLDGSGQPVDAAQAYSANALPGLAARAQGQPMMAPVQGFLNWAAVARPRAINLEWDLDPDGANAPLCPGAFFSLPDPAPADPTDHVTGGLTALHRAGFIAPVLAALACCAPDARLRQLGVLISRPDAGVRLVLDCGSADAARSALRRLSPASLPKLETLLALPGFETAPRLDLDVLATGIGPRIGVECGGVGMTLEKIRGWTDGLVQLGLMDPAAARALDMRASWQSLDAWLMSGLSHLKATTSGIDRPQIKAYQAILMRPDASATPRANLQEAVRHDA